jgi:hypothetical protein
VTQTISSMRAMNETPDMVWGCRMCRANDGSLNVS